MSCAGSVERRAAIARTLAASPLGSRMSYVACGSEHQNACNAWVVPALRVSISFGLRRMQQAAAAVTSGRSVYLRRTVYQCACDTAGGVGSERWAPHQAPRRTASRSEPHTRIREDAHSATLPPVFSAYAAFRQLLGASEHAARTHTLPPRRGTPRVEFRDATHFFGDTCQVRPEWEAFCGTKPTGEIARDGGSTAKAKAKAKKWVPNFCVRRRGGLRPEGARQRWRARPPSGRAVHRRAPPRALIKSNAGCAREATPGERARECANAHERDRAHARRGNVGRGGTRGASGRRRRLSS